MPKPADPIKLSSAATVATKGDGETWEDYAHRLEERIKQQRDHIKNLTELRRVPGDIHARKRIATLERLLGKKEVALAQQHEGLHALKLRIEELEDTIRDMLDVTVGYCRPMTDAEKLDTIRVVGEKVLGV